MSLVSAIRETYQGFKSLVIGMKITAREAAKPIITVQYPRETLPMPARFRGHVQLVLDPETGKARCTACGLCARACPSGCIVLDGVKREGDKRKSVSKYDLDFTKCSLCGSCVEICPSDALEFSKAYNVVSLDRADFSHIDLFKQIDAAEKAWAAAHPQAVVAPAAPPAAAPAVPHVNGHPASPAVVTAADRNVRDASATPAAAAAERTIAPHPTEPKTP
jgi:NADH-quinone oxidoreductase subunit I